MVNQGGRLYDAAYDWPVAVQKQASGCSGTALSTSKTGTRNSHWAWSLFLSYIIDRLT